jgi:catechol 2,3-dioxygenase-like lactoylglutathione lyase family enzyme
MAATARRSAADLDLKIQRLNHFTLPVRDHEVARRFYCDVLGAKVVHDVDWSGVKAGRNRSTALGVKLFDAPGVLDLFSQPFGQPPTDASHPHFAFMVENPEELDRFADRLRAFSVPFVGPLTRRNKESLRPGDRVPVELYFNDPDGNHLELNCSQYPYSEGMHVGPYDRWELLYSWRDWRRSHVEGEQAAPAEAAPPMTGFSHYTLPVRDLDKAELFYTQVLGADFVHRSEPDRVKKGLAHALQVHVKLCEGIDISLFQQPSGWLPADGSHPHQAFDVPPEDLERWIKHLEAWDVPHKLVCRQKERPPVGTPCKVELYFFDPDGNHLELDAQDFPANEKMHMGTYDHFPLAYAHNRWPTGAETSSH